VQVQVTPLILKKPRTMQRLYALPCDALQALDSLDADAVAVKT
jgi:hypothetical protein